MPRQSPAAALRPHRDDVLIALAGLLGGLVVWAAGLQGGPELAGFPAWVSLVALAMLSGAELLRRTAPGPALGVAVPALTLDTLGGTMIATVVMFTDVVYAAVVYGSPRMAWGVPRGCVVLTIVAAVVPLSLWRDPQVLLIPLIIGIVTATPAFTGMVVRNHRDRAAAERLRAEQTVLLAEMDRTQAVTAERARMARELHDVVANHLSAIAIHATAAQNMEGDARATRDALGVIRENSVQGLTEMRRLIGILRDASGSSEPDAVPTLDGIEALLERARSTAAGRFQLVLEDERRDEPVTAPVALAAYRIVQEALTNALKHAAPGEVVVELRHHERNGRPTALLVRVTSPLAGRASERTPRAPGSGAGLVGMRERVELLGGTLDTGPVLRNVPGTAHAARRVWEVRAELPAGEERYR